MWAKWNLLQFPFALVYPRSLVLVCDEYLLKLKDKSVCKGIAKIEVFLSAPDF